MAQKSKAGGRGLATKVTKAAKSDVAKKAKSKVVKPPAVAKRAQKKEESQIAKAKAALKKQTEASQETASTVESGAKSRGRKISIEINPNEAASALSAKWTTLYKKAEQIEAKPYNMKQIFEEKTAIVHKVLGWGFILANRNDRLEVLFKDGIKYLISNYKP